MGPGGGLGTAGALQGVQGWQEWSSPMSAPTHLPLPSLPEPDTVESQTWSLAFMLCPAQVIIHPSVKQSTEPQPVGSQLGCPCCHCLLTPPAPAPPDSPAPSASPPATPSPSARHARVGTGVHMQPGTRCQLGITSRPRYPGPDLGVSERGWRCPPHPCRGTSRPQGSQTCIRDPAIGSFLLCPQFTHLASGCECKPPSALS